jgi:hypothetical protein
MGVSCGNQTAFQVFGGDQPEKPFLDRRYYVENKLNTVPQMSS